MNQTPSYVRNAAAHAWLRYISKWVSSTGHVFSASEVEQIMNDSIITSFQKAIFLQAIAPDTPTNEYVVNLRRPQQAKVQEIERRLRNGEKLYH
jgi:hypothetical protein